MSSSETAERAAEQAEPAAFEAMLHLLIDGTDYALPVSETVAVVSLRETAIFPIPFDTSGRIRGIFNYKGKVVALVRIPSMIAASDRRADPEHTAVILCDDEKWFALLADQVDTASSGALPAQTVLLSAQKLYFGE